MTILEPILRWSGARFSSHVARSIPVLGAVVAVATLGVTMRRKGVVGGLLDAGLNAVPVLGAAKSVAEVVRGKDFVPDRPPTRPRARRETRRVPA